MSKLAGSIEDLTQELNQYMDKGLKGIKLMYGKNTSAIHTVAAELKEYNKVERRRRAAGMPPRKEALNQQLLGGELPAEIDGGRQEGGADSQQRQDTLLNSKEPTRSMDQDRRSGSDREGAVCSG
jgi:hypothetical protein